jgi:dTDP-4-dehydrorhamnose 3,5-epimerase
MQCAESAMNVIPTALPGVLILEPRVFGDERGFFLESFNQRAFEQATGLAPTFVQDNHSRSTRGVLRGLHYQLPPHSQGKLVRVTQGAVFDVAVVLRRSSPSFGRWVGAELSGEKHRQLWLPPGVAHGFMVTSESADFLYKTTEYYVLRAHVRTLAALGRPGHRCRLAGAGRRADAACQGCGRAKPGRAPNFD